MATGVFPGAVVERGGHGPIGLSSWWGCTTPTTVESLEMNDYFILFVLFSET